MKFKKMLICILLVVGCSLFAYAESESFKPVSLSNKNISSRGSIVDKPFENDKVAILESVLDTIMERTKAKGVSAAVGIPEKGLWYSSRGTSGNESNLELASNMMLYAGSIGKIFTAVIIMKIVEENRLSLDSSINNWFPDIDQAENITIDHLLTHTSGIPSFDNLMEYQSNKHRYHDPADIIDIYVNDTKLLFEPGKHYSYSNTGYLMLGIIIEKVTKVSYKEAVYQYLINEIGLKDTDVLTAQANGRFIVRGHHQGNAITLTTNYAIPSGAGSIIATPKDLVFFFQALTNGRIISENSLENMLSDMNRTSLQQAICYGKGVVAILDTPIGDIIGHTGEIEGFKAALYYHPDKNIFVSVMMNDDIQPVEPAVFRLMEVMLD